MKARYLGHKTNKAFYYVIGFLVVLIVFVMIINHRALMELREDKRELMTTIAQLEAQRDALQEAYGIVLEDARAFGEIYETSYDGPEDLVEPEPVLEPVQGTIALSDTDAWSFYNERDIIKDECIDTAKLIRTPSNEVEFAIVTEGDGGVLRVLINAQEVTQLDIADEDIHTFTVALPKGTHYLDLVYGSADVHGDVTVSLLRIGDRTLDTDLATLDYGVGFGVFDCESTKTGDEFKQNGAMRFQLEKA